MMPRRPAHAPAEAAPRPPAQKPIELELGGWSCKAGDFDVRLVVRRELLDALVRGAMVSKRGRSEAGGGAFVVLARRRAPAPKGEP